MLCHRQSSGKVVYWVYKVSVILGCCSADSEMRLSSVDVVNESLKVYTASIKLPD
jgi:hypothetical protein